MKPLTLSKTIVLVTSVFLASAVVTIPLLSHSLYLAPPMTNGTAVFYPALTLAPAVLTLILCARARPSGLWISRVLLPVWVVVLLCLYLVVVAPALFYYSAIDCRSVTRSGLLVQHVCTCRSETPEGRSHRAQVNCSLDGSAFSPLLPVTERGEWQAIP